MPLGGIGQPEEEPAQQELLPGSPAPALVAFDEMNIIETPFALLSHTTSNLSSVKLSDSTELIAKGDRGLPTYLADRAVLGLMWLAKERTGFKTPVVRFELRDLVCSYMFRNRAYRPSGKTLQAVEEQLNRVAFTRIVTDNWWDSRLKRRTPMNAAIIDYVQVLDEGGRNQSRVLEIRFGEQFYRSIKNSYTKAIDADLCARISHPLDLRLYRWLDRQLHGDKRRQRIASIQQFNRAKLLLTGKHVLRGGRTASGYLAMKIKDSLKRLDGVGFQVRLEIDMSVADYALEFFRLEEAGPNEIIEEDHEGDLVRLFRALAHGAAKSTGRKISRKDRALATEWIEAYGEAQAAAIVRRCVQIQKEQGGQRILTFQGLSLYESAAAADLHRVKAKQEGQLELELEAMREEAWISYQRALLSRADEVLSEDAHRAFKVAAEAIVDADPEQAQLPNVAKEAFINIHVRQQKLAAVNVIPKTDFMRHENPEARREALVAHHGFDPLG